MTDPLGEVYALADFFAWVAAGVAAEEAAYLAAQVPAPAGTPDALVVLPRGQTARGGGGVGECTGFVIPDAIIQRESGGNAFIQNSRSDAFGCAQTLLRHYYGGACDGMDPYTIQGQRDCVYTISDGGTNLQPWSG